MSENLSGVRLFLKVENHKGQSIKNEESIHLNKIGFQTYEFKTGADWGTGDYVVSLFAKVEREKGRVRIGSINVRLEEFMPDRLKILANLSKTPNKGWLHPEDLEAHINLKNLFGAPAQNRRVIGKMSLTSSYPSFNGYKDWKFHSPMWSQKSMHKELGEKMTDKEGNATFKLWLDQFDSPSYLLHFMGEGFEAEGGRSVQTSLTTLVSPLKYLVGYKAHGNLDYIDRKAKMRIDFIAIDAHLKKVASQGLKVKIVKFRNVSTLVRKYDGTYKYESIQKEYEVKKSSLKISPLGASVLLDTSQVGDFAFVLLNSDNLELSRIPYSVAGESNLASRLEKNSELNIKLNKTDFVPGDEIEININSPYIGSGLIYYRKGACFCLQMVYYKFKKYSSTNSYTYGF